MLLMQFLYRTDYTKAQHTLWDKLRDEKPSVLMEITKSLFIYAGCAIGCTKEGVSICDYENDAVVPGTQRQIIKLDKAGYRCFISVDASSISISIYTGQDLNCIRIETYFRVVYFKTFKEV